MAPTGGTPWTAAASLGLLLLAAGPAGCAAGEAPASSPAAQQQGGATTDAQLLLALKATIQNAQGTPLATWTNGTDPCGGSWGGVDCVAGRVEVLNLTGGCLSGRLPPEAGWQLPDSLTILDLGENNLTGTIPHNWTLPPNLQILSMRSNTLIGSVPVLHLPGSLQKLDFAHNRLHGELPPDYPMPPGMLEFGLEENMLQGSLPTWSSAPASLRVFVRPGNDALCGPVPTTPAYSTFNYTDNKAHTPLASLRPCPGNKTQEQLLLDFKASFSNGDGVLSDWKEGSNACNWSGVRCEADQAVMLSLSNRYLEGTIPVSGWELPDSVTSLGLGANNIEGPLPAKWPKGLKAIYLLQNPIGGSLPNTNWLPSELQMLGLSRAQLVGTIPGRMALPKSLLTFDVGNNSLTGATPSDWVTNLPRGLQNLWLGWNNLTLGLERWRLPDTLRTLDLSGMRLNRTLAELLGDEPGPTSLQWLSLRATNLSGGLPEAWTSFTSLTHLYLQDNQLGGTLPEWANMPNASVYVAPGNPGLCGQVPGAPQFKSLNSTFSDDAEPLAPLPDCAAVAEAVAPGTCDQELNTDIAGAWLAGFADVSQSQCCDLCMANTPCQAYVYCDNSSGCRDDYGVISATRYPYRSCYLKASGKAGEAARGPQVDWTSGYPSRGGSTNVSGGAVGATPSNSSGGAGAAGIAPGVAGGCAAAVALMAGLWWWRRHGHRHRTQAALEEGKGLEPPPDMPLGVNWEVRGIQRPDSRSSGASSSRELLSVDPYLASIAASLTRGPGQAEFGRASGAPSSHSYQGSEQQELLQHWVIPFADLQFKRLIGAGAFGRVYLAEWHETLVAVKLLLGEASSADAGTFAEQILSQSSPILVNLRQEAGMMVQMRHPNVLGFLGLCSFPPALVAEYCPRGSLFDVLREARASPAAAALTWCRRLGLAMDAAKGMLYLHSHRPPLVHRDLKSPNILVAADWTAKVCDFNLSRIMEGDMVASGSSATAVTNPRWLAPEVLGGETHTFESDVFSFAIVLWELLTWQLPWRDFPNPWQVDTLGWVQALRALWPLPLRDASGRRSNVAKYVMRGGRLPVPEQGHLPGPEETFEGLPNYLALLHACWAQEPEARPTFAQIIPELRRLLALAPGGDAAAEYTATERAGSASVAKSSRPLTPDVGTGGSAAAPGPTTPTASCMKGTGLERSAGASSPLPRELPHRSFSA